MTHEANERELIITEITFELARFLLEVSAKMLHNWRHIEMVVGLVMAMVIVVMVMVAAAAMEMARLPNTAKINRNGRIKNNRKAAADATMNCFVRRGLSHVYKLYTAKQDMGIHSVP